MRYNFAADSFYIMKLCSRLFVLYCRSRPKDDKSRHFDRHFEEVRGGVEPGALESPYRVLVKRKTHFTPPTRPDKTVLSGWVGVGGVNTIRD